MSRVLGMIYVAVAALIIGLAPVPSAQASPLLSGIGNVVQGTAPAAATQVQWRGGRGYRGHRGFRGHRGGYSRSYYRPHRGYYRRAYYRPNYYRPRPVYYGYGQSYGRRCFWRPARYVNTYYGYQLRPARRICRY
jgi:hypothetical protein